LATSEFILVLLGSLQGYLAKQLGEGSSWDKVDTQQREGVAGDCVPHISSETQDKVFASLLSCPQAASAMERGTRT